MDLGLSNRVIMVTGGSGSIGRATALAFGSEGSRVAVTFKQNEASADQVVTEIKAVGGDAIAVPLDLSDSNSISAALKTVTQTWKSLDVLVNNAVAWPEQSWPPGFATISPQQWRETLRVNLEGVIELTQAALPSLLADGFGRVVSLSSGVVEYGMPGEEVYAAAKSGLIGFTRCLAREVGSQGVLANVVMPGLTLTDRSVQQVPENIRKVVAEQAPSGRLSTPQDVASTVLFLGSRANANITGEIVRVSGGN